MFLFILGVFVLSFFFKGCCKKLLFCLMIFILFCFGGIVVGGFIGCKVMILIIKVSFRLFCELYKRILNVWDLRRDLLVFCRGFRVLNK